MYFELTPRVGLGSRCPLIAKIWVINKEDNDEVYVYEIDQDINVIKRGAPSGYLLLITT